MGIMGSFLVSNFSLDDEDIKSLLAIGCWLLGNR